MYYDQQLPEYSKVPTKEEARRRGLKKFYTGKPCIYGHDTLRYASSGRCCACDQEKKRLEKRSSEDHAIGDARRKAEDLKADIDLKREIDGYYN